MGYCWILRECDIILKNNGKAKRDNAPSSEVQAMQTDTAIEEFASLFGEQRVKNTLRKMVDIEISHCQLDLKKARAGLQPYEERFQMSSHEAWKRFNKGELGDNLDIMEWMGLYENCLALEQQLKRITGSRAYAELLHSTH